MSSSSVHLHLPLHNLLPSIERVLNENGSGDNGYVSLYVDSHGETYEPYSMGWRYLGMYLDCDINDATNTENVVYEEDDIQRQRRRLSGSGSGDGSVCARKLLWAAVSVILVLSGVLFCPHIHFNLSFSTSIPTTAVAVSVNTSIMILSPTLGTTRLVNSPSCIAVPRWIVTIPTPIFASWGSIKKRKDSTIGANNCSNTTGTVNGTKIPTRPCRMYWRRGPSRMGVVRNSNIVIRMGIRCMRRRNPCQKAI